MCDSSQFERAPWFVVFCRIVALLLFGVVVLAFFLAGVYLMFILVWAFFDVDLNSRLAAFADANPGIFIALLVAGYILSLIWVLYQLYQFVVYRYVSEG